MIRYSSYGATNFQSLSAPTDLDPLKAEYRKLLELRERVRAAEEAGPRSRLPRPSSTSFSLRIVSERRQKRSCPRSASGAR